MSEAEKKDDDHSTTTTNVNLSRPTQRRRLLLWLFLPLILAITIYSFSNSLPAVQRCLAGVQQPEYPRRPEGHLFGSEDRDRTQIGKEKASMVMLVRNRELPDALKSIKQIESRFNHHYRYPWTFLNDAPFTPHFIAETTRLASGHTFYGQVPPSQWSLPPWINTTRFNASLTHKSSTSIPYGNSRSYRHMCRYQSGFFHHHELLQGFDYYWRVEPSISFYCDQTYDPFTFMRENGKKYSFVISLHEFAATIPSLWRSVQEFAELRPELIADGNALAFIVDEPEKGIQGSEFNMCHFWSNFELGDLGFWRGEAYSAYFEFLDRKGGFYYERWGDAPVHSIAAALLLKREEIHFWRDMGYRHVPWARCPDDVESHETARCDCPFPMPASFDYDAFSCHDRWHMVNDLPRTVWAWPEGYEEDADIGTPMYH